MTMHDDPNMRLLERDLEQLVEPRAEDERLRRAIRRQLAARMKPRPRRRLSLRIAVGSTAMSVAAAAAAIVVLVGANGSAGTTAADAAIVHLALKAVAAHPNSILHTKVVGVQNGLTVVGESWQQTSAPYASRYVKGAIGHQSESADNGTMSFQYDAQSNTIVERPESSRATFANPMAQIRQALASGQAHFVGIAVIDGAPLYKIDLQQGRVVYFDPRHDRPRYLDNPQGDGTVVRLRFAAYEYLPMTEASRAMLSIIAQHPSARVEH
jgi:hypothetical protein